MIRLLVGPYRSGKTGQLLRDLVASKKEHPFDRCLILVPSQRYGGLVRAKLGELAQAETAGQPTGMFAVEIATIFDACSEVLRMAGEHQLVLPKDLSAAVVSLAIQELQARDELTNLRPISHFAGTSQAVLRLLDEFERAALPPAQVVSATANTASSESKYRELAAIYRQYWEKLDDLGCLDQKRMAFACREVLSRKDMESFRLRWLIVDGFDRLSPLQAEVIQALSQHAAQTHIAFDYVEPALRNEKQTEEYGWKDSSFEELSKRFRVPPSYPTFDVSTSCAPAETAFKTLDSYFEMVEIARRCKEAILHRDVSPGQILVVARDINDYAIAARAAFDDARIPYSVDQSIEFKELPLFKLLMKLASLAQSDFSRRQVCECLRSAFIDLEALGLTRQQVESLDKKSLEMGVLSGREQWESFLLHSMPEHVFSAITHTFDLLTPPEQATVGSYCRWLEGVENLVIRQPARLSACAPEEIESIQGLRTIVRTLVQQESIFKMGEVKVAHFLSMLISASDNATFRRSAAQPDCITICAAEHAPNRRYDEVFVAGVIEGRFPKHTGEKGFVSADERARWASFGVLLANPREEVGFERALFKSLIERARKRVCFSLPEFTNGGDEAIVSFFLTDGSASPERIEHIKPAVEALRHPISPREAIGGWLWLDPGIELSPRMSSHSATEEFWQTINVSVLAAYQRHQKNASNAYNGYLVDLTESQWLQVKLPNAWSASALNNYGQCPFKFWMSNILRVEPRREPQLGLAVDIKGRLYHKALEIFYARFTQIRPEERTDQRQTVLKESLLVAIESIKNDPQFTPGPYWDNEQKDMLFRLDRFIDYDDQRLLRDKTSAQPALFEARFGLNHLENSYPALTLQTKHGPIVIRGVIDRVDIHESQDGEPPCATVIDYKTSSSPITLADAQSGTNLQLPIYALAVSKSMFPNAKVSHGHYLSINGARSIGSIDFNQDKSADLLESTIALVSDTVSAIKAGDFGVRPRSAKACQHCSHKPVCRVTDLTRNDVEEA